MGLAATRLANVDRARLLLARDGFNALLGLTAHNVYYLSGSQSDWLFDVPLVAAAILPLDEDLPATLVVHDVELTNLAEAPSWMPGLRVYRAEVCGEYLPHYVLADHPLTEREERITALMRRTDQTAAEGYVAAVAGMLSELGLTRGRIALDEPRLIGLLARVLPELECVDRPDLFRKIRIVKTDAEIALMRGAAEHNHAALAEAMAVIDDGVLWSEVERAYNMAVVARDGRPACFYVGAGRRSGGLQPHGDYAIAAGDHACFDAMATWSRYHADMQRTASLGPPSNKLERYWRAISRGVAVAYDGLGPGVSTGQLRRAALDTVRAAGIPSFRHAFIHGLGLEHIELPTSGGGFPDFALEAGMIVNMDMEVCELGFGGVYFEDSMLITQSGAEPLVHSARELVRL